MAIVYNLSKFVSLHDDGEKNSEMRSKMPQLQTRPHPWAGLGSNTFYQIQIQIQIQKFGFFKYKYKYFLQPWFKYKYKYKYIHSNTNTNTNTFNQIYLPKLFRIQNREILQIPRCMLMACVSLCLGDTWSLPLCISGNFTGTRAVGVGWG